MLFATMVHAQNLPQEQFSETDPLLVESLLQPSTWSPGQAGELILKVKLPPGYHAYEDKFELVVLEPDGFKKSKLQISPLKKWFDKFSKKDRLGVESQATIKIQLEAPHEFKQNYAFLKYELHYQACGETFCLFPTTKVLQTPLHLIGVSNTIEKNTSLENTQSVTNSEFSFLSIEKFKKSLEESIWLALLFSFLAGILTSFTPCIFPMIPITLAILGRDVEKKTRLQNFLTSLFYVLGIAFTYSSLGLFAATSGKLFGANLGNPWVLAVMCLLLLLMAFSLFGFFELQVPAFIRNKFGVQKKSNGYGGAFFSGLIAGLVASPCVGPVLVAILGYVATQKSVLLGFWLLFFYAFGLGMIFLLLGLFTNLMNYLPRSGPWMNRSKAILGFLVLGVCAYYMSLLIPNSWMISLRKHSTEITGTTLLDHFGIDSKTRSTSDESAGSYVEPIQNPEWKAYTPELYNKALADGRPIIIDFYAEWCAACHELDQKTFTDPAIKKLGENFVLLRFDATQESPQMDEFKKKYMILGLPTVVFYSPNGKWRSDLTLTEFENVEKFSTRMNRALLP